MDFSDAIAYSSVCASRINLIEPFSLSIRTYSFKFYGVPLRSYMYSFKNMPVIYILSTSGIFWNETAITL